MFIYSEIHAWCIILDVFSVVKLLTCFMLVIKHLTLMSCLSYDFYWFYLFCNICLFFKFLVSRISSCLNVILIISCWLNSFLLRMFKCHFFVIVVFVYHFCVFLLISLKSIMSVCVLKNHVLFFHSFFLCRDFLSFSCL